jgi:hypothetical protein
VIGTGGRHSFRGRDDWPTDDIDSEDATAVLPVVKDAAGSEYRGDDCPTEPSTVVREGLAALQRARAERAGASGFDRDDPNGEQPPAGHF